MFVAANEISNRRTLTNNPDGALSAITSETVGQPAILASAGREFGNNAGTWIVGIASTAAAGVGLAIRAPKLFRILTGGDNGIDLDNAPNTPDVDPTNPRPGSANSPDTDAEAGSGTGGIPSRETTFTPDPNNPYVDSSAQVHIIEGNVRPNGSVSGAHYANSTNIRIDPSSVTMDPGGSGVFTARVDVCCDAQGNFVPKSNSPQGIGGPPYSTFFPESWNSQRVLDEIASAARQAPADGDQHDIMSRSGVKITVRRDATTGKLRQAFPAWPQ